MGAAGGLEEAMEWRHSAFSALVRALHRKGLSSFWSLCRGQQESHFLLSPVEEEGAPARFSRFVDSWLGRFPSTEKGRAPKNP